MIKGKYFQHKKHYTQFRDAQHLANCVAKRFALNRADYIVSGKTYRVKSLNYGLKVKPKNTISPHVGWIYGHN